jgi:hypothetical protein
MTPEGPTPSATADNIYSSYREVLIEHLFAGEAMRLPRAVHSVRSALFQGPAAAPAVTPQPRLLDRIGQTLHARPYSRRTELSYCQCQEDAGVMDVEACCVGPD